MHDPDPKTAPETPLNYEPPRLEAVGSLRDLVGKSGARVDIIGPEPKRP